VFCLQCRLFAHTSTDSTEAAGDSAVKALDTVVVRSGLSPFSGASSTVLETGMFQGLYADLPAVLEQVGGLTVRRTGGTGRYADVSVRGSTPQQVQVFLDGLPLNPAWGGPVDIGKIPLTVLDRIEVYRTAAPLEFFGLNAGGVISLATGRTAESVLLTAETASFGRQDAGAFLRHSAGDGRFVQTLLFDAADSDNDYPWVDSGVTLGPDAGRDDTVRAMDNNRYRSLYFRYANSLEQRRFRFGSTVSYTAADEGIFLRRTAGYNDGSVSTHTALAQVRAEAPVGGSFTLDCETGGRYVYSRFDRDAPYHAGTGPVRLQTQFPFGLGRIALYGPVTGHLRLHVQGAGTVERAVMDNLLAAGDRPSAWAQRALGTAGTGLQWSNAIPFMCNGSVIYRYESDRTGSLGSPGFDLGVPLVGDRHLVAGNIEITWKPFNRTKVSAGAAYRPRSPSLYEKFGRGTNFIGNAGLKPEWRAEADAGVTVTAGPVAATLSGYVSRTRDLILSTSQSQGIFRPDNIAEVHSGGIESSFRVTGVPWLVLNNSLSYGRNLVARSDYSYWEGTDVPLMPRLKEFAEAGVRIRSLELAHTLSYESSYYLGIQNHDRVSPDPELGLRLCYTGLPGLRAIYRLDNYTDVRNYDFRDSPRPGRCHAVVMSWGR